MFIGVSTWYLQRCLLQEDKGRLSFPKGLSSEDDKTKKLSDCARKWKDGRAYPTERTLSRMRNGDYGLAGLRSVELMDSINDVSKFIDRPSLRLADWTMLPEYVNIVQAVDKEILRIVESGTQPGPDHSLVPESIVEGVRQCAQNGNIEPVLFCQSFLYSLVLFDANPNLKAEPFREVFFLDVCSTRRGRDRGLQWSFVTLIRQRIKRGGTIEGFAEKMFPYNREPRKSFDNQLSDPKRIIQPNFIKNLAETYYDFVLGENKKSDELKEMLPKIWNFIIQVVVIMDKMGVRFDLNFREIARERYDAFRECADSAWKKFS